MRPLFYFITRRIVWYHLLALAVLGVVGIWGLQRWLHVYTAHDEYVEVPDLSSYSLEEVRSILDEQQLFFSIIDSAEYNPRYPRGAVVGQIPGPYTKVKAHREIFLTVNPRVPGRQPLPDIIDRSLRQASAYLNARGFRIGQIEYVPDMAKDVVLAVKYRDNEVPPQTRLPQNATVDLVLGQGLGSEFVSVPRLLGLTLAEAEVVLMQAGINMGAQSLDTSLTSESDTSSALIFRQSPMAYKSIRQGGSVDLWFTIDRTKIPSDTLHLETDTLINDF